MDFYYYLTEKVKKAAIAEPATDYYTESLGNVSMARTNDLENNNLSCVS